MVEIKIDKKFFVSAGIVAVLCIVSFFTGRFTRFGRVSGNSEELIGGIVLAGDTANSVLDRLGISRSATDSATDVGYAVSRGIEELQRANEKQRICLDKIIGEVEYTEQNISIIQSNLGGVSESIQLGFKLAEEQARAYETIVDTLHEFDDNSTKDE